MKEKIDLFIELSLQQCKKDDYADPKKIKIHNKSLEELLKLKAEINITESEDMMQTLLLHNDSRVKINASQCCMEKYILVEQAKATLENVIKTEVDSTLIFSAKQLLKQYTN
ncbi:MAG: hypothetical protein IKK46_04325 [Clostridia bacterium]|nr:hypothetical protein [Clostridia bacterium]